MNYNRAHRKEMAITINSVEAVSDASMKSILAALQVCLWDVNVVWCYTIYI